MNFQPQLSQEDLAKLAISERLEIEWRYEGDLNEHWKKDDNCFLPNERVVLYQEIRLAPGALTEFGLKPGMEPNNPDVLTADVITEGGKYRACVNNEVFTPGTIIQTWVNGTWISQRSILCNAIVNHRISSTIRVPVSTPFPKLEGSCESIKQELDEKISAMSDEELKAKLNSFSPTTEESSSAQSDTTKAQVLSIPDSCFKSQIMAEHRKGEEVTTSAWKKPDVVILDSYKDGSVVLLVEKEGKTDVIEVFDKNTYDEDLEGVRSELTAAISQRDEARKVLKKIEILSLGPDNGSSGWIAEQSYQLAKGYLNKSPNT